MSEFLIKMTEFPIDFENDRFSRYSFFKKNNNSDFKDYLDFSFKGIGDQGIYNLIIQQQSTLNQIKILYLGANQISGEGISILSNYLINNQQLQHLSLESNHIGDQGCLPLGIMLRNNNHLISLIIGGNNISDQGAIEISESLKINQTLQNLVLVNNNITQSTLVSFIETLKLNKSLARLSLNYRCSQNEEELINSFFSKNTSLLDCSLDFIEPRVSYRFSYNLNFNRYLNTQRREQFQIPIQFFIRNVLIGFYKSSSFYQILPLELSFLIGCYLGVKSKYLIKEWEKYSREIWTRKYSYIYKQNGKP